MYEWLNEQFKKMGKTWAKYDGIHPAIFTIDPDFIKEVLIKQFDNFTDAFDFNVAQDQETLDIATGEKWRQLRKMMSPTFTSGKLKVSHNCHTLSHSGSGSGLGHDGTYGRSG